MSFLDKLFFWSKSKRIRESDIKFYPQPISDLTADFPQRRFFPNIDKPQKVNRSTQTDETHFVASVQCDLPLPIPKVTVTTKPAINLSNDEPVLGLKCDLPFETKPFYPARSINLKFVEEFIHRDIPDKPKIGFVFNKEPSQKVKNEEPKSNRKSDEKTNIDNEKSHFGAAQIGQMFDFGTHSSSQSSAEPEKEKEKEAESSQSNVQKSDLPKPKGKFVFVFN
ncbi:hypothetical protein TRFO_29604 [Tritrichomonas foetus]|uniref:Uncharacterized protein n=1 Tax=Tritrichomonas foetus TaxID=1144522 RepID=A0A1J4JVL1_9EUKA|nr:hypothetical protein TRFO_29604 [Tritrichomonas foetus]|eukprot:OHT03051.1 hypothetical protein TRFO_29604 [Tritrichomonas foetus]